MDNPSAHALQGADDLLALDIMVKMLEHMSPFGHILSLLHDLLGGLHELEIEGLAGLAMGLKAINIDPKHALNPALAYLVATSAWKEMRPAFAKEFERRKGRGLVEVRRALPIRRPTPR